MLHFDTSDLAQPRLLYTQAGYVPARQCATECGLNVGRWWIETEQTHEDRPVYTAELSAWTPEQRAAIAEAHELARRHAQKSRGVPSTDDIGWFEEQWLLAHPIEPSLDNTPEQLMALARQAFLQAPAPVAPAPKAAPAPRPAPAPRAAPAAAAGATTAAASAAGDAAAAAAASAAGAGGAAREAAYGAPVGPPPVVSVAPQQPDELPSAEPFDPNKPAKKGRGKASKTPILLAAPPTPEPPAPMTPEPPAPPPAPPAPVAALVAPAEKAPKAAAPKAGAPLKASLGELLAAHAPATPAVTAAPTPAPAPVAPAAPAPAPKKRLVSAKPSAAATTAAGSEPETKNAAKAAPEQPRTPELDRARAGLLTVLSRGARVPGARLLLQLRARGGATAIYSAAERRFVALGYVG